MVSFLWFSRSFFSSFDLCINLPSFIHTNHFNWFIYSFGFMVLYFWNECVDAITLTWLNNQYNLILNLIFFFNFFLLPCNSVKFYIKIFSLCKRVDVENLFPLFLCLHLLVVVILCGFECCYSLKTQTEVVIVSIAELTNRIIIASKLLSWLILSWWFIV